MNKASGDAWRIRDISLSFALMNESDRYDPSSRLYVPPVNARKCYDQIARLVNEEPAWSFEDVMYWAGRRCYEPAEVLIKRYKKCRQVFEKAKMQVKQVASVSDERQKLIEEEGLSFENPGSDNRRDC